MYLYQHGYVALVAILFLTLGLTFFLDAEQPGSLGRVPPFDYMWNASYALGGAVILAGWFSRRPGIEAAGHIVKIPGVLLNLTVAAAVLHFHYLAFLLAVFATTAAIRTAGLVMGWQEDQK